MLIRQLTEDDAEAFRALRLRALQEHPEAFGTSYEETVTQPLSSIVQRLRPDSAAPHNFILGAFDDADGALIGMVGFYREHRLKTRHKGSIWGMYVSQEAQGRGAGRALLEKAIAVARAQPGLEQITLMVVSTNEAARRLYHSFGFETYGTEPRALKIGERYSDEDLMILRLQSDGITRDRAIEAHETIMRVSAEVRARTDARSDSVPLIRAWRASEKRRD